MSYSGIFFLIDASLSENNEPEFSMTAEELLDEYISEDDGPLIFMDNEAWQNEIDTVCRKLYKFLNNAKRQ